MAKQSKFAVIFRKLRRFVVRAVLWFLGVSVAWVLLYRWVNPPITVLQIIQGTDDNKAWKSLDEISSELPLAVIASEDQRFLKHWGFDTNAIAAAMEKNKEGKKVVGASTISQQTAKNVFLWPSRTWVRKGLEAWFTLLIETLWPKERIMEVYLNVIEMGPQCFGAEAAAKKYFRKPAAKLSRSEAALIAAALPQPRKSNPGKPSGYLSKRGASIQKQMRNVGGVKILPWREDPSSSKKEKKKEKNDAK
ncbi:MAG: monofunctional biosynthetic peptidoglycan transglycosylase [Flavobacteriales bacterium]